MSWSGEDGSSSGSGLEDSGRQESLHNTLKAIAKGRRGSDSQMAAAQNLDSVLKRWNIQYENLPQRPFFGPLFGYTKQWQQLTIGAIIDGNSQVLGRPVTSQEAQALAHHASKKCARETWVSPAVLASAAYMTYRGRRSFRFPFYAPQPDSFHPTCFPSIAKPWVTGQRSIFLWNFGRFGAYAFVCHLFVGSLVEFYAHVSFAAGFASDPRLKSAREAISQRMAARREGNRGRLPPPSPGGPNAERQQQTGLDGQGAVGGTPEYEQQQPQPQQQQQQQQPSAQWSQTTPGGRGNTAQDDDSFLFDDGSPVAPSQRQRPAQGTPSGSAPSAPGQGSAWDRIRQRVKSEEGAWSRAQQQDAAGAGAGARGQQRTEQQYTYTSGEQEKAYAKEQAQKEFDAMLERERRGEGNSGGSGRM